MPAKVWPTVVGGLPEFWNDPRRACVGIPTTVFFPGPDYANGLPAKQVCDRCPLIKACRAYALTEDVYGVWGGTTPRDRQRERKRLNVTTAKPRPTTAARRAQVVELTGQSRSAAEIATDLGSRTLGRCNVSGRRHGPGRWLRERCSAVGDGHWWAT